MKLYSKGFTPLQMNPVRYYKEITESYGLSNGMNNSSSIDYGNVSGKIVEKKRLLSVTGPVRNCISITKNISNGAGFTLPELLLAVVILAFALTGLLQLFSNCTLLNAANRNLVIATSHAQYIMEGIRHTPVFTDIQTDINNHVWDWNTVAITARGLTALNGETIDTEAPGGGNPLQVVVTVSWNDRGQTRNIALQTLITDY